MLANLRRSPDLARRTVHAAPGLVVPLVLLIILPASLSSLSVAFLCISALVVMMLVLVFGSRPTGTAFLLVGYGTVTFNDTHPIASLGWMELADPFLVTGFFLLIPGFVRTVLRLPAGFLVGAMGLLSVGTLSPLFTEAPGLNFALFLDVAQGVVLLPVLLAWWQPGLRAVTGIALAYVVGSGVNVVSALLEGPDSGDRYSGLSTHPNVMGYCQVLSIALVPFLLEVLPRRYHWIIGAITVVSIYGIWISGSRAALLGGAILILLYPLLKRSIPVTMGVAALCLPVLVVLDSVADRLDSSSALGRLLGADSARASNEARREGAQAGIDQFLSHPLLGDGWATVWGAHNGYLQVAAAIGVFGFVFYGVLLGSILRPLIAIPSPYGLLAVPGLAALMLDLVLPVLGARYVWCAVGLSLCAYRLADTEGARGPVEALHGTQEQGGAHARRPVASGSRRANV